MYFTCVEKPFVFSKENSHGRGVVLGFLGCGARASEERPGRGEGRWEPQKTCGFEENRAKTIKAEIFC